MDTTSNVLNWLLVNLAQHPAAQERLAAELAEVLGGEDLDAARVPDVPSPRGCGRWPAEDSEMLKSAKGHF